MQITGAGPAPQTPFDLGSKIEKQSADDGQTPVKPGGPQAVSAPTGPDEASPIAASSDSSKTASDNRPSAREPGVGTRLDVSA